MSDFTDGMRCPQCTFSLIREGLVAYDCASCRAREAALEYASDQTISAGTGARSAVVRDPGDHDWPASALSATDVLDPDSLGLRDLREAARTAGVAVPTVDTSHGTPTPAERCQCGQLVGRWNRTHHKPGAKPGDKPCDGSW